MITQATSNQPADPTCREISALTIKMPEPTMMPATIIMESKRPSASRNSEGDSPASAASMTFKSVPNAIRYASRCIKRVRWWDPPELQSAEKF